MNSKILFCTAALLAGLPAICLADRDPVAFIDSVRDGVTIESAGQSLPAVVNMKMFAGDFVRTGSKGSVGLIFDDDTVVAVGPDSEMKIEEFLYHPVEAELSFVAKMFKGTFSFITGQIAKLAPEKVRLETPEATLGVRGTKFAVKIE